MGRSKGAIERPSRRAPIVPAPPPLLPRGLLLPLDHLPPPSSRVRGRAARRSRSSHRSIDPTARHAIGHRAVGRARPVCGRMFPAVTSLVR
jgi:hypothetical protein